MVLSQAVLAVLDSCQIPQDKQIHLPVNVIDSLAFQAQAAKIASTWRWSVPQQPPRTLSRGSLRRSSQYSLPSSRGLPASNSALSSSSAWLQRDALARTPGTLDAPPPPGPHTAPGGPAARAVPARAGRGPRGPPPPPRPPPPPTPDYIRRQRQMCIRDSGCSVTRWRAPRGPWTPPPQMPSLLPLSARLSGVPGQAVPSSRVPSPPHTPPLYRAFACSRIGSSPQADDLDPLSSRI